MTNWLRRGLLTLLTLAAAYPLLSVLAAGRCDSVASTATSHPGARESWESDEKIVVEARCRNFVWYFQWTTPHAGLRQDFQLTLPAESEVELRLASDDYIYAFDLDTFGVRQMVIPGRTYHCQFKTGPPQSIELIADPLCGFRLFHDEVMGKILVADRG